MGKARHGVLPAECLVEQYVEWGRRQPLLTTDDVGNLHQMVINDIRQMIGGQFIGTLIEHLVVEDVTLYTHLTADHVVDQHFLASLNLDAHHILGAFGNELLYFVGRQGQRVAHLHASLVVVLEVLYFLALGIELLGRVEGYVGLAVVQQLFHVFLIDVAALALTIRTVLATERHSFVELDAQPVEGLNDIGLSLRNETGGIGILNAEYQVAAMLTGKQIII